jgi:hypothetical protein
MLQFFLEKKSDLGSYFFALEKSSKTKKLETDQPTGRQVAGNSSKKNHTLLRDFCISYWKSLVG